MEQVRFMDWDQIPDHVQEHDKHAYWQRVESFRQFGTKWVECQICGLPTDATSLGECAGCWECTTRLNELLRREGGRRRLVAELLEMQEEPLLGLLHDIMKNPHGRLCAVKALQKSGPTERES